MESMFTRKKTVLESEQMISKISLQAIKEEFRALKQAERAKVAELQQDLAFKKRMNECERLNQLIKQENPSVTESAFEKPGNATRENPFFQALRAQKQERERYKQMIEYALKQGESSEENSDLAEVPSELKRLEMAAGEDVFKMTNVDADQEFEEHEQRKEIFFFYQFNFELPSEYYKALGDFSVANHI